MDKYIGRLLDNRYEILEVIGTGGMAVVYKARCHRLNRLVAIKILKDDYLQDEDFRRRFHVESQAVAMLSHPNIVSVYDVSTSIMADYIVMELIEGITLKQYMEKKGILNWKETLHFAIQIGKALEHAHSRGIVHRDIKPHNVMVLKNGSVKVTDFGIARMMSKGNTLTKEALGSVHYISPEQAKGGRVDSRSDIYSLGVVMYEMMSGRPPYDGESPVSVAIQHINGGAIMPSILNPNIPGGLEQIIMKAMAHELEDRYESATQMLRDMDEFRKEPAMLFDYNTPPLDAVTALPGMNKPAGQGTGGETSRRRNTGVIAAGGAGAAAGAGAGAGAAAGRAAANPPVRRERTGQQRSREQQRKRQKEREAEENRSRVATIAIIVCSLVAVIAIGAILALLLSGGITPKDNLVETPDLVGKNYEELPDYAQFQIRPDRVYDNAPAGQIIKQMPEAGKEVVKGTKIVVTVSKGPAPLPVYLNDLTGLSETSARRILDNLQMNLVIKTEEVFSESVAVGNVISTKPVKETELTAGQMVTLVISKGPEIKDGIMPGLIGQTETVAKNILNAQSLNLKITVEQVFNSTVEVGKVISTDPEKGRPLQTGMNVKLVVSKGAELKKMPNLVGFGIQDALNVLKQYGFNVMPSIERVYSEKPKDTVIEQSHLKDQMIDVNSEIVLKVSDGPEPTVPEETTQPAQPEKTQNVIISLKGLTQSAAQYVTVTRDGYKVFEGQVEQGCDDIELTDQTGAGTVVYSITVNGQSWSQSVEFV